MTMLIDRSLSELTDELNTLRYQANTIYTEASASGSLDFALVKAIPGSTSEKVQAWSQLQARMSDLGAEVDRKKRLEMEMKQAAAEYQRSQSPVNGVPYAPGAGFDGGPVPLNLGKALLNNPEFKALRERDGRGTARLDIPNADFKTLIQLSGISPQNDRRPFVNMRLEERTVIDAIGESEVSAATVEWYEETTVTNAAVETAEGSAKPEGALAWTLRTSAVKTIAVWIPVTRQALGDVPFLESEIRNRLTFMVQRREEQQVLTGDAAGENLRGILNTSGIQTQAKGADATPTAFMKAMAKVRGANAAGFTEPDLIVMHPNDYVELMSLQATTGEYILQAILQNSPVPRLWGVPIRQTTAITEGTGLVGDFALSAEVYRRDGITVTASSEHASYFIENKVAILAESRIALGVQVPSGFCTVTGI